MPLKDGKFKVKAYANGKTQTFFVGDEMNIYLISRTPLQEGDKVEFNVQSTALAMVTLHPLFSPIGAEGYQELIDMIKNCSHYNAFYKEVEKAVHAKQSIFGDNDDLLLAFSELIEEICGEPVDDGEYDAELDPYIDDDTYTRKSTRAIYQNSQINPDYIDAQINGACLSLRTFWLTPTYYGTIEHPSGFVEKSCIPCRSDFGILDVLVNRTAYGKPVDFYFPLQGEYRFYYSRTTPEATIDFYIRLAGTILSSLGLEYEDTDDEIVKIAYSISNAMIAAGTGVCDTDINPLVWLGIARDAALAYLKEYGHLSVAQMARLLSESINYYGMLKGSVNLGLRIGFALNAPEDMSFCLCCYKGEISTCAEASLLKIKGDNQVGYSKQKLLLPLAVYVETTEDNLSSDPSSYHRVKFEVISGGGRVSSEEVVADNMRQAATYWTLGQEGEQKVKATVIDVITKKEISEPVYFTATLKKADVTVRLEWNKHSGDTDIDLHVIDPYGEEIYFENMYSVSGGFLDWDDVVGPGPEHIHWDNAPVGTYKIMVHYFPNEEKDRSVTNYKVSVTANGKTFKTVSGPIRYNERVEVGQFTIGNVNNQSNSLSLEATECKFQDVYPKKIKRK